MGRRDAAHGPRGPRRDRRRRDPGETAPSCCRRFGRRSPGKAGSLPARSTTSASASPWRPPRRGASPRSTPCSRSLRRRRRSCTSATTSPAAWPAARSSSTQLRQRLPDGPRNPHRASDFASGPRRRSCRRRATGRRTMRSPRRWRMPCRPYGTRRTLAPVRAPLPRPRPRTTRHAKLRLLARVGHVDPGSLEDYRKNGGYAALEKAFALGARGHRARGPRVEARRPRRRGLSRPAGSGRPWRSSPRNRTTSSATPTSPSPAPSRTASSWRRIPSPSSRR